METKNPKQERDFYPRGLTAVVPPTGKTVPFKVEEHHGKRTRVRQIFAENIPDVTMTITKAGAESYVDNVALSVMSVHKPLPVKIPMGDYKISFTNSSGVEKTVNIAFIMEHLG